LKQVPESDIAAWSIAVLLFRSKDKKRKEAQGFLTKIINNHCPTLGGTSNGERGERRINLTMAVFAVPIGSDNYPDIYLAFATVTKELSTGGMALITTRKLTDTELVVVMQWDGSTTYFRCEIRHQSAIGAGLWQCGLQVNEILPAGDYPHLSKLEF